MFIVLHEGNGWSPAAVGTSVGIEERGSASLTSLRGVRRSCELGRGLGLDGALSESEGRGPRRIYCRETGGAGRQRMYWTRLT